MATLKSIKNKYLSTSDGDVLGVTTNTENVAALSFKLATADSLSKFNMVDGFTDGYQDATGVDAGGSTNEVRDSSGKYYSGGVSGSATGGTTATYSSGGTNYTSHTFLSSGTFTVSAGSGNVDALVVGGGGNSSGTDGNNGSGGGGAGGFRAITSHGVTAQAYSVTVGAATADSSFSTITASGGGAGSTGAGSTGGSGGGTGGWTSGTLTAGGAGNEGSYSPVEGYDGGYGSNGGGGPPCPNRNGGGGGGAGGVGGNAQVTGSSSNGNGGSGGAGATNDFRTGSNVTYAGGGGGSGTNSGGSGGSGGGGAGGSGFGSAGTNGTANTGGGAGGGSHGTPGATGGTGIVVIRYADGAFVSYNNMTLKSNAFTAQVVPTTSRIVLDEESVAGATTINTDIKAYASRDNGTTYTQVTLADQGQLNYLAGIDQYTKLMLHCDGSDSGTTFTDSSATGHTMTASGNVHTDTTIKKFGTASAQFDGTTDYITSAASTEFSLTGDFTIDCWCYFGAINTTIAGSLSNWDYNSASTNDWILLVDGGGNITFNVKNVGGLSSSGHGALNAWKHIAVERASGTTKIYVDGVLGNSGTGPGSGTVSANNIVTLGRAATNLTLAYNGYIDEFRISKGIARYGAAFIPAATPYEHSRRLLSGSVDISGQPSGTNMKYKIETLNQAVTKQTRIYGTSMAWA